MTASFARATFERAATTPENMPPAGGLEVAFAGRSNAGKSSAINALVGQRRLAYTSKTPGRTQEINFFALGEQRFLVDLPGYGYAAVPRALRGRWERVLHHFLRERESLRGLVVIVTATMSLNGVTLLRNAMAESVAETFCDAYPPFLQIRFSSLRRRRLGRLDGDVHLVAAAETAAKDEITNHQHRHDRRRR